MKRFLIPATFLGVLFAAIPAFADKPTFPMKADEFQKHVDARIAKARTHMEARITKKGLDAEKAKEARARFDAKVAKVQAAAKQAEADGTVTEDEAKAIRAEMHHKKK